MARVINGVRIGDDGVEIWECVDPVRDDLAGFDVFIWHDSITGLNHRTDSIDEAVVFNVVQAKIFDVIDATEVAVCIE